MLGLGGSQKYESLNQDAQDKQGKKERREVKPTQAIRVALQTLNRFPSAKQRTTTAVYSTVATNAKDTGNGRTLQCIYMYVCNDTQAGRKQMGEDQIGKRGEKIIRKLELNFC